MSGGLDSTMAAYLLKKQGFKVFGVTMKIWDDSIKIKATKSGCYGPGEAEDIISAQKAAKKLEIPHYVLDLTKEYKKEVLKYFQREYRGGRTPNPCIVCNSKIKFGYFLDKINSSGMKFDFFATGHYARIEHDKKRKVYVLKKGKDISKDQSYFLYRLNQDQLGKVIFPLGDKNKTEIRMLALKVGFKNYAEKPESQNFIECDDYSVLFKKSKPGEIVDFQGKKLGTHKGIWKYTIGQRRNLRLSGLKEPYYVLKINAAKNKITVGPKNMLASQIIEVRDINWIIPPEKKIIKNIKAKIRYGSQPADCLIIIGRDKVSVEFKSAQLAVTPGQSIVFYKKDMVLGGGIIK